MEPHHAPLVRSAMFQLNSFLYHRNQQNPALESSGAASVFNLCIDDDPFNQKIAVLMGIHCMHRMWSNWKAEKGLERLRFALAS